MKSNKELKINKKLLICGMIFSTTIPLVLIKLTFGMDIPIFSTIIGVLMVSSSIQYVYVYKKIEDDN